MGEGQVIMKKLIFVSFNVKDGKFVGSLSLDAVFESKKDPEVILYKTTKVYEKSVQEMRSINRKIEAIRSTHQKIPAKMMWKLGNAIFKLKENE